MPCRARSSSSRPGLKGKRKAGEPSDDDDESEDESSDDDARGDPDFDAAAEGEEMEVGVGSVWHFVLFFWGGSVVVVVGGGIGLARWLRRQRGRRWRWVG